MANLRADDGTELTPELIEQLADEFEADHDLSRAKHVRRGRPSLSPGGVSPRLQLRLDPELAQAVHDQAAEENCSVSEVVRNALRAYVIKI